MSEREEKRSFVLTPKKKDNPHSELGDIKMLTLNGFAEDLKHVYSESISFSAVSKPDVGFVKGLVKIQIEEVHETFAVFTTGLVNQLMLRIFDKFICRYVKR